VLRALVEAGIKVDIVAGHGVGAFTALCAAVDGGTRLWDAGGLWSQPRLRYAYRWRRALRLAGVGAAAAGVLLLSPLIVLVLAAGVYVGSVLAALASLPTISAWLVGFYGWLLAVLFDPPVLPTIVPRAVLLAVLAVVGVVLAAAVRAARQAPSRRRLRGAFWWRLIGSPLDAAEPAGAFLEALWQLVRGASGAPRPRPAELGMRYVELLADNFGQPGFREVLVAVHDIDARRDLVAAVLPPQSRAAFEAKPAVQGPREAEALDLTGPSRAVLVDLLAGALALPVATEAHAVTFPEDSYWRGETHRLVDRPGLPLRLVREVASLGAEQVILVSAAPPPAVPHGLRYKPGALRARMGEILQSVEAAALEDAAAAALVRFSGAFVIRPDYNPIGPFDFAGVDDEASDRRWTAAHLVRLGYEDAYREFIEPVVAAGERIELSTHSPLR
jgi:hypothetical protein